MFHFFYIIHLLRRYESTVFLRVAEEFNSRVRVLQWGHSRSGEGGRAYLLEQVNICPTGISTLKPVRQTPEDCACTCNMKASHWRESRLGVGMSFYSTRTPNFLSNLIHVIHFYSCFDSFANEKPAHAFKVCLQIARFRPTSHQKLKCIQSVKTQSKSCRDAIRSGFSCVKRLIHSTLVTD